MTLATVCQGLVWQMCSIIVQMMTYAYHLSCLCSAPRCLGKTYFGTPHDLALEVRTGMGGGAWISGRVAGSGIEYLRRGLPITPHFDGCSCTVVVAPHGMHCAGGQVLQHDASQNHAPDLDRAPRIHFVLFITPLTDFSAGCPKELSTST